MTSTVVDYEPVIQNALVDLVAAQAFPLVEYVQGRMTILEEAGSPASVTAHAETSDFSVSRDRRSFLLDRSGWAWRLELSFSGHVALGRFERSLMQSPPVILRDRSAGRDQQVTLILTSAAYQPPPEGQPATGMRATFRFNAQLTPS